MKTLCDIAPTRLLKNDFAAELAAPAQRPVQLYKRILVGTDFSPASLPAFEQALKLAGQNHAELLLAHACMPPDTIGFMPWETYHKWEKQCRAEADKYIGALIQRAHKEKLTAHMLMLSGPPEDALLEAARKLCVDLIIIGTHGRRAVSRFFLGSVAARIVSRAPCPVLTVSSAARTRKSASRR